MRIFKHPIRMTFPSPRGKRTVDAFLRVVSLGIVTLLLGLLVLACGNAREDESLYPVLSRSPLEILQACPEPGAVDIHPGAVVEILFNKDLNPSTVTNGTVMLALGRAFVKGNILLEGNRILYIPIDPLYESMQYDVYITSGLRDKDNFAVDDNYIVFSFVTGTEESSSLTCR